MEALGGCTTFLGEMGDEMAERGQLSAIGGFFLYSLYRITVSKSLHLNLQPTCSLKHCTVGVKRIFFRKEVNVKILFWVRRGKGVNFSCQLYI